MDLSGKEVTLHDMSLRDGMHAKQHQISLDDMVCIAKAMDEAGMPLIEVTHGDGLGGAGLLAPTSLANIGGPNDDTLLGGDGNDTLLAGAFDDSLAGPESRVQHQMGWGD